MENNSAISNMILKNAMVLQSQPKWTFSKNTCNTYEVFVSHFRNEEGPLLPSWPILRIVEQNAKKALSIADRAYVLETGKISIEGPAKELMENDEIRKAYLGE